MADKVLAEITPSFGRRAFALFSMIVLGALCLYIAFAHPPRDLWAQAFLIGVGLVVLWGAEMMRRATRLSLELTEEGLRDSSGVMVAPMERIVGLDRGMFAFKPSNGFIVRLDRPHARCWRPGLYWRLGRSVGVGGVTVASQAKMMADLLTIKLAEREGP